MRFGYSSGDRTVGELPAPPPSVTVHPEGPANDRRRDRTRNAALQRLAEEYPERFRELLAEVRKDGPTPWDPGDTP